MKHTVEEVQLKNGAHGLLIDIPGASVMSTRIQFRAGMMYAKNHEVYEIPHVVEHLAFGANANSVTNKPLKQSSLKMAPIITLGPQIFQYVMRRNAQILNGIGLWSSKEFQFASQNSMKKN